MACPLPRVAGSLSDATKLKFSNINSQLAELLFLDASPAGTTAFTSGWTETDSGGKVNIAGGIVTMDGAGAWTTNGLALTAGVARAQGYFEIKVQITADLVADFMLNLSNQNTLRTVGSGDFGGYCLSKVFRFDAGGTASISTKAMELSTWYTIRMYPLLSGDGTTWKRAKMTIQGGVYTTESPLGDIDMVAGTGHGATLYLLITRNASDAAHLVSFKEFYWYSGFATDGPYVEYVHDAGAGKIFNNFDPSALAMPGTVPSTNLKFAWSFDDGVASYSAWLTLAELNAVGKQTADHRYIRLRVQSNSDGSTQAYVDKPNSDTATDGIGDFPGLAKVMADDTVQGSAGTLALANVLVAAGGTFDEAARNKFNTGTTVADLASGKSVKLLNVDNAGTSDKIYSAADEATRNTDMAASKVELLYAYNTRGVARVGELSTGLLVPGAIEISTTTISSSIIRVNLVWAANAATIEVYRATTAGGVYSKIADVTSGNYYDDTGRTASTSYYYKARGVNATGNGDYGAVKSGTTAATMPILTACEARIVVDIEAMTIAGGYNYDWGNCNERDFAQKDAFPNADIVLQTENCQDEKGGTNANAYTNEAVYNIIVYPSLTSVVDKPEYNINAEYNKVLDDLKKCFGTDINLNGNCYCIRYLDSYREKTNTGDILTPGRIITKWAVSYAQDITNPSTPAN